MFLERRLSVGDEEEMDRGKKWNGERNEDAREKKRLNWWEKGKYGSRRAWAVRRKKLNSCCV